MSVRVRYPPPLVPRIWILRLGTWVAYEQSFVGVQDDARIHRYYARAAAKVAREVAKVARAAVTQPAATNVDQHVQVCRCT
jgi:hypothetical protein